jgi:hypothetical protein
MSTTKFKTIFLLLALSLPAEGGTNALKSPGAVAGVPEPKEDSAADDFFDAIILSPLVLSHQSSRAGEAAAEARKCSDEPLLEPASGTPVRAGGMNFLIQLEEIQTPSIKIKVVNDAE